MSAYATYVRPILDYCNYFWHPVLSRDIDALKLFYMLILEKFLENEVCHTKVTQSSLHFLICLV